MSITVSTPQQICNSQLNLSKSKSLYSFPKALRFNENSKPLCDNIYETPSSISKRKAGFGYGTKSDFTSGKFKTPAPSAYSIKTEIEIKKEQKSGYQFGESRSKMKGAGIFQQHLLGIPGPGTYVEQSQLSDIKYTFRPRTVNPAEFTTAKFAPGPGQYEKYETVTLKGKLFNSKFKSSGATTINPARSQRFDNNADNKVPGAGNYSHQSHSMKKDGNYFVSTLTNSFCRSFPHSERHGIMQALKEKLKVPGVGQYRLPSEFGYYEARKQ